MNKEKYKPQTKDELIDLIERKIKFDRIDTSFIKDMSGLFENSMLRNFKGIETWDTSKVTDMSYMFCGAKSFNHDISNWNVSKVKNMSNMFCLAEKFNQPLNSWDVSNVTNMENMFRIAKVFNQPLDNWNVSKVKNIDGMFWVADSFNQNLDSWVLAKNAKMYMSFYCSAMQDNTPIWYKSE